MASTHSDIALLGQTHVLPPLVLPDAPGGRCHQGFVVVQSSAWGSLSSGSSERLCKTSQGNGYRHWVVECSLIIHDFTVHRAPEPLCSLTESFSMNWVELRALWMHNILVNATILLPMVNVCQIYHIDMHKDLTFLYKMAKDAMCLECFQVLCGEIMNEPMADYVSGLAINSLIEMNLENNIWVVFDGSFIHI